MARKTNVQAQDTELETAAVETKQQFKVKQRLTPHTYVTVRNGFNGKLIYKSARTNEVFVWEGFGDEQEMELQELKNAKGSGKAFFEKNWFLFDDPEVIAYLGLERMYANALTYREFDDLFTWSPDEIADRVSKLSNGQRQSLSYMARTQIAEGKIDSIKLINALEQCLGTELIER